MRRPIILGLVNKKSKEWICITRSGSLINLKSCMKNKEELFIGKYDFYQNRCSVDCFLIVNAWNLENETFQE